MNEFFQQIREQVTRIWENLSMQQKVLFVAAPVVMLLALIFAVYLASRPQMVTLISLDNPSQLDRIVTKLEEENINYKIADERTIQVDKSIKARALMKLSGESLIGPDTGTGWSVFDQTRLGMTDRMFDTQYKIAIQDELEKTIVSGADNIVDARVHITFAETSLFKEDSVSPSASVKLITRGNVNKEQVLGIQNLVAGSIPKLEINKVYVLGQNNKVLSEDNSTETGVGEKTKQLEMQLTIEDILRRKVEDTLSKLVGENNYDVKVTATLDLTKERSDQTVIQNDSPAPLSEKTYEEISSSPSISGAPGVESNAQTQDTGVGSQTASNTSINESITNYQYPWMKIIKEMPIGEIKEISVSIALNYEEDPQTGDRIPHTPELLDKIRQKTRADVGLPPDAAADTIHKFVLIDYLFSDAQARQMARDRMCSQATGITTTFLPLILLLVLGFFAYRFFQSAFAPPEIEGEEMEEVPIEPVTETKELSLSQLGLAEFGDIASLPAEEQRRLKMQEHVINYASEKPEEVAAIIKAWLTG